MKKVILLGLMAFGAVNAQAQNWLLLGNAGTNPATNFLGTTDNKDVVFRRFNIRAGLLNPLNTSFGVDALNPASTGIENTAIGQLALYNNTSGGENTAIGVRSLNYNTTGEYNTASGYNALAGNTTGTSNSAVGSYALFSNTTGGNNVANGHGALLLLSSGYDNVGVGYYALRSNAVGSSNTAIGSYALYNNKASNNTATGNYSLYSNITGTANTANGFNALYYNTSGRDNIANGYQTLFNNNVGFENTATGNYALKTNTGGSENTAYGYYSLTNSTGSQNTAVGNKSLLANTSGTHNTAHGNYAVSYNTTGIGNTGIGYASLSGTVSGSYNSAIGFGAGPGGVSAATLTNTTALGFNTVPTISSQVILGNTGVTSILGYVNVTITSDGRFKNNIQENVPGLDFINLLKPVTYNYKIHDLHNYIGLKKSNDEQNKEAESVFEAAVVAKEKIVYTGFVAQEVEKAADKVGYNFSGIHKPQNESDPYGLSYAEFVPPLVKAVQELSAKNEDKQNEIIQLQNDNKQLNDKLKALEEKLNALINHSGAGNLELDNKAIVLDQNAPNPFAESTIIGYELKEDFSTALISISNNNGLVLKTYPITTKGKAQVTVYGSNLSSGVYRYTLIVDGKAVETKTMIKN